MKRDQKRKQKKKLTILHVTCCTFVFLRNDKNQGCCHILHVAGTSLNSRDTWNDDSAPKFKNRQQHVLN